MGELSSSSACISLYGEISVWTYPYIRISRPEVFYTIGVLKIFQNSQENICARVSFSIKLQADASSHCFWYVYGSQFSTFSRKVISYITMKIFYNVRLLNEMVSKDRWSFSFGFRGQKRTNVLYFPKSKKRLCYTWTVDRGKKLLIQNNY